MQQKRDGLAVLPAAAPFLRLKATGFPSSCKAPALRCAKPAAVYNQPSPSRRLGQRALHRPQPSHRVESITIWPDASREMAS